MHSFSLVCILLKNEKKTWAADDIRDACHKVTDIPTSFI